MVGWYNVTDYATVELAVTAAKDAGGGVVYFPAGTYAVDGLEIDVSGISLVGDGPEATILTRTTTGGHLIKVGPFSGSTPLDTPAVQGVSIVNLSIRGPGAGAGQNGDGIFVNVATEGENSIDNVRIIDCDWGITLRRSFGFGISNCRIDDNKQGGVRGIDTTTGGNVNQITLVNCWLKRNHGPALEIPAGKWTVVGGVYENNNNMAPNTVDNILIHGSAYTCAFYGVYMENAPRSNVRVLGTADGMSGDPRNLVFSSCYIQNSFTDSPSVYLGDCTHVRFDNCVWDGDETPIEISSNASDVEITLARNSTLGPKAIVNNGTRVTIERSTLHVPLESFSPGERSNNQPETSPVVGSTGANQYLYLTFPNSGGTTSIVTMIPLPVGWQDDQARLKLTIYTEPSTSSVGGNLKYEYTAVVVKPGVDTAFVGYQDTGAVVFARNAGVVGEHALSGLIQCNSTSGLLRLRIARLSGDPQDTYDSWDRFLGVKLERVQ